VHVYQRGLVGAQGASSFTSESLIRSPVGFASGWATASQQKTSIS
jgi:hypothetical protein